MKLILVSITLFCLCLSAKETTNYGKKLTLKKSQTVTELLKKTNEQKDQQVQVTGRVKKVCPMMGCWLELEDTKTKKIIKVKVKDGDIVFPESAINKTATVEGKLIKKTMSKRKAISYYRHLAEELGESFDPKTITGPVEIWEVKGSGAIIK